MITLFQSCTDNHKSEIKSAFNELVKRYPELYSNGVINSYTFKREVYNSEYSIKMELFDQPNSENEIVVLSDEKGQISAIPFPDNDQRSYWIFHDEKLKQRVSKKNFNAVMHKAFNLLAIKEGYIKGIIFNDMMFSLLQATPIFEDDSSEIKNTNRSYPDSCGVIVKSNFKAIFDGIHESSWIYLNTFNNFRRGRYFQFIADEPYGSPGFKIIVYRRPCVIKPIYL
ncbi:hypothetical protein [Mucilaginibacter sp.]|uniref:hypothetical protein n=1 Tax=Mucilaginibacter sp. TaxID=1882438 RepID=UPI002843AA39|nr:hypothetical protein [Mucilaginibacter sp.]MDR3694338.1 hypothetical protein [Mucilaginibacter sp.]